MSRADAVTGVVAALMCMGAGIRTWLMWNGRHKQRPVQPYGWWPFGVPGWHAFLRAGPLAPPVFSLFLLIFVVGAFLPIEHPLVAAVVLAACAGIVTGVVLTIRVVLYNEPKRVVPPHLRKAPGLLEELRRGKS